MALYGDGGGKAASIAKPLFGRTQAAHFLAGLGRQASRDGFTTTLREVNGHPAVVGVDRAGRVIGVMTLHIVDGAIAAVRAVVNSDKLGHFPA